MRYAFLLLTFLLLLGCETEVPPPGEDTVVPVRTAAAEADTTLPSDSTVERLFRETMDYAQAQNLHERPIGEIMQTLGLRFVGDPYAAGMLDAPPEETLVVALNKYDCVTFVETMLALAQGVKAQDYSYATFARNLEDLRYRGGELDGYPSRLHYFTDWIYDNAQRGNVEAITASIGGVPFDKTIDFMGTHRDSYARLEHDSLFQAIQQMERSLADRDLYYIPQDAIADVYDQLQAGDIIATATDIKGLDVTHTGLVYQDGEQTGLLHASLKEGVKVSPDLQDYVQGVKAQIGIIVARPKATSGS